MTWQPDGWSARTRIGVLTPHADVGPKSELKAMAPEGVAIHASRVAFGAMSAGFVMDPTIAHEPVRAFAEPPHIDDAAELLAAAPLNAITIGFTSSGYVLGPEGEAAMVRRVEERTNGIPVIATCSAVVQALRVLAAKRMALVDPPWFDAELNQAGRRYYEEMGFEVVYASPCDLPSDQRRVEPDALYSWLTQQIRKTAEAIVIGGNGFRAVGIIEAVESALGCTVLSANQVLMWAALKAAHHLEVWRLYQSGQFYDLRGMPDDWRDQSEWWSPTAQWQPGQQLGIGDVLFTFTQIFEFAARLSLSEAGDEFMEINVVVAGLKGRQLWMDHPRRLLLDRYISDLPEFPQRLTLRREELTSTVDDRALDAAVELFRRFNWEPNKQVLREHQLELKR